MTEVMPFIACSGVGLCLFMWSSSPSKGEDTHNRWTTIQGSRQSCFRKPNRTHIFQP
jgi:hypothetical protein